MKKSESTTSAIEAPEITEAKEVTVVTEVISSDSALVLMSRRISGLLRSAVDYLARIFRRINDRLFGHATAVSA